MVPFQHGGGLYISGIGTRLGLGDGEGGYLLPAAERGEVFPLLLLSAVQVDGHSSDAHVGADEGGGRGAGPGELLQHDAVAYLSGSRPAILFGEVNPQEALLTYFLNQFGGNSPLPVYLVG